MSVANDRFSSTLNSEEITLNYFIGGAIMLRLLIVLFVYATIICPSHESCDGEPEIINKNYNNPMQEYYQWNQIEIDYDHSGHSSSEYFR